MINQPRFTNKQLIQLLKAYMLHLDYKWNNIMTELEGNVEIENIDIDIIDFDDYLNKIGNEILDHRQTWMVIGKSNDWLEDWISENECSLHLWVEPYAKNPVISDSLYNRIEGELYDTFSIEPYES